MVYLHNIDPVLFSIGPLEIRYYGLAYIFGLLAAYFILKILSKRSKLTLTDDDLTDFVLYEAIGLLLGGRVFYTLIYNLPFYLNNPLKLLAIWEGGMSFHGGFIGALIAGYLFCKKKNISFYQLADLTVIPLAFALCVGRIANFINAELIGRAFTNPQSTIAQTIGINYGDGTIRHPSQLYASLKNLVIFTILWFWNKKDNAHRPDGVLFWGFVALYGLFRFVVGFFRAPDQQLGFVLGPFTMGQLLAFPMFVLGAIFIIHLYKKNK